MTLYGPTTLFGRLVAASADDWRAYVGHPFVRALDAATLPEACFRRYLGQDYLFLIQFARAYALAAYKAEDLDDIRQASAALAAIVDREMALHVAFAARWGVSENEMRALPEADATTAYTRFVLDRGAAGDLLDLHVALAPCIVGYAEIGLALSARPAVPLADHPYREWIEAYAAEAYVEVARAEVGQLDRLMANRGGEGRFPGLAATFRRATRLESAFWAMGLSAADARPGVGD